MMPANTINYYHNITMTSLTPLNFPSTFVSSAIQPKAAYLLTLLSKILFEVLPQTFYIPR